MGYIFEAEIDAIMTAVRARTVGEEDGITLRDLLSADVHPAIKAYFRAEVEKTLGHERANEQRSRRFPYAQPEVVSLQQQIDRLLVLNYHFDRTEFDAVLDQSVHFQFNYLCRPQWTLLNFILGSQRRVSTVEVEKKLQYCVDYTYFPELIRRYYMDRGLVEVTYEDFKALLERIDREVVARHSSVELARMLRALSAFVDESRLQPHDQFDQPLLPTNAAIVFFEDKQIDPVKVRLEYERDAHMLQLVSLQQIAEFIEMVHAVEASPEPVAPLVPSGVPPNGPPADEPLTDASQPAFSGPEDPAQESSAEPAPPDIFTPTRRENKAHTEAADQPIPVVEAAEVPMPEIPFPVRPAAAPHGLLDVHDVFTDAERKKFIKMVFKKDERAFRTTLDELNLLPTWQETSLFLDSLFVSLDVDPFGEPAVHFTDRLYTRFYPDQPADASV